MLTPMEKKSVIDTDDEVVRLRATHDALVAALRETLDCLINETAGHKDTPWVAGVKTRARSTLNAIEGE